MLKDSVIQFFGNQTKASEALGYKSTGTISQWTEIIPENAALKLHMLTNGALNYDPSLYQKDIPTDRQTPCTQSTNQGEVRA